MEGLKSKIHFQRLDLTGLIINSFKKRICEYLNET